MISIIVLAAVFILIAVRKIGNIRLQIWQIMLAGALAVLLTGQIAPLVALRAINADVMLFLFGMFVVGEALIGSGYLSSLAYRVFSRARSADSLLLMLLFGIGIAAAFLMNDTLAIIGTPVVLMLARCRGLPAKPLLLALAFAVTIGSVMSPIGNPQNLLIAIGGGVANPFITFFRFLLVPTLLNLLVAFWLLRTYYRREFRTELTDGYPEPVTDPHLARLSEISLVLLVALVVAKTVLVVWHIEFPLTYIALTAMLPVVLFSPRRLQLVRRIDWHTLIFFAAMFVLTRSVWDSGFFQGVLQASRLDLTSVDVVMSISVLLSQLISNVPLVALYLPMLSQLGTNTKEMMALAAGATIAGNLTILGAASNVIIIQNAEERSGETLTFFEFARIGLPLTVLNMALYAAFLRLF